MSTLKVNTIEPYSGGTVAISGYTPTNATSASYATVANGLTAGNKSLSGALTQNFTAPALNNEVQLVNVSNASISGKPYNRVAFSFSDFSGAGLTFEDYFGIEYYDSFGYNFGTEFNLNGKGAKLTTAPSGSGFGQSAVLETLDNFDGTSTAKVLGTLIEIGNTSQTTTIDLGGANTTNIHVSGSVNFKDTLNLASQNPLPAGSIGDLAVSGSSLYFYNGAWTLVV